jgi:hypothetical protein
MSIIDEESILHSSETPVSWLIFLAMRQSEKVEFSSR